MLQKSASPIVLAGRHRRDLPIELCAIKIDVTKALKDPEAPVTFEGYGSVWGRTDSYGDTIHKGAFAESLKKRRPIMLYGHNSSRVPGKWVQYDEDEKGLFLKGELTPRHSDAQDLAASLKHESITGLSIGGYTVESTPKHPKNPWAGRDIHKFDLYEVSPVAMPAENEARIDTASIKAVLEQCEKPQDFEEALRDVGFSSNAAKSWVSRFISVIRGESPREPKVNEGASAMLAAIRDINSEFQT